MDDTNDGPANSEQEGSRVANMKINSYYSTNLYRKLDLQTSIIALTDSTAHGRIHKRSVTKCNSMLFQVLIGILQKY